MSHVCLWACGSFSRAEMKIQRKAPTESTRSDQRLLEMWPLWRTTTLTNSVIGTREGHVGRSRGCGDGGGWTRVWGSAARSLPSQEALGKRGELAFPVLNEGALGHEAVELLPLLRHHHPRVLLHAQPQACKKRGKGRERVQRARQRYSVPGEGIIY